MSHPISTNPGSPGVAVQGVCRRFGSRWALIDVSFEVPHGGALILAGRNGSGKTTLLRVLATAIRPDRGTARLAGLSIADDREAVRRQVGLLSHQSYLYEMLTALENLRVAARLLGRPSERKEMLGHLERVGLADRADDPVATFSAGMRKRLSLARTLLQEPSIVLLDEPYGQLDPPGFALIDHTIRDLRRGGATVVLSTHQIERGSALCDVGVVLAEGRVAWTGPARSVATESPLRPEATAEGAC
jgi:heme exporter protein A